IKVLSEYMSKKLCDIATLASKFNNESELKDLNNVKVLTNGALRDSKFDEAIDFQRSSENIKDKYAYHHIGIYAFTREALLRY